MTLPEMLTPSSSSSSSQDNFFPYSTESPVQDFSPDELSKHQYPAVPEGKYGRISKIKYTDTTFSLFLR